MIQAHHADKEIVINILCESFDQNKSVNYVVKQDGKRKQRIRQLMDYSFEICFLFGQIFLTEDKKGCVLTLFPDKKKTSLKTIQLDLKMIIHCVGLKRVLKILKRNSEIENEYPKTPIYYLWFIGVLPSEQRKGTGSNLLHEIIKMAKGFSRPIYLETSMIQNLPFYERLGFTIYRELDFGYKLFLLKKD